MQSSKVFSRADLFVLGCAIVIAIGFVLLPWLSGSSVTGWSLISNPQPAGFTPDDTWFWNFPWLVAVSAVLGVLAAVWSLRDPLARRIAAGIVYVIGGLGVAFYAAFFIAQATGYSTDLQPGSIPDQLAKLAVLNQLAGLAILSLVFQVLLRRFAPARIACAAGCIALVYFGAYFVQVNVSWAEAIQQVGIGFWLALLGALGLAFQVYIPRPALATPPAPPRTQVRRESETPAAAPASEVPPAPAREIPPAAAREISPEPPITTTGGGAGAVVAVLPGAVGAAPVSEGLSLVRQIRANLQTYALIGALIVIWGIFYALRPDVFLSPQNFSNLFRQMTTTAFLSVGMVLVIVTGRIDLSVGKLAGFVSVVVAFFQAYRWRVLLPDAPEAVTTILAVAIGLGVGILYGVVQGYIIAYLQVPAFIVTLGSLWLLNGLILIQTAGKTIPSNQPMFSEIGQGYLEPHESPAGWIIAGIVVVFLVFSMFRGRQKKLQYGFTLNPLYFDVLKTILLGGLIVGYVYVVNQYSGMQIPVLLLAVVAVVVSYISDNTQFGRYVYAIGGNSEAARLSGVNVRKMVFYVFVLMGFLCGVGGIVLGSYVGYGTIGAGQGYELDAIAACILGGTSPLGGEGTILGAMVGALIMATLTNGLQILNFPAASQFVVKAAVLVLAVYLDVQLKKNR